MFPPWILAGKAPSCWKRSSSAPFRVQHLLQFTCTSVLAITCSSVSGLKMQKDIRFFRQLSEEDRRLFQNTSATFCITTANNESWSCLSLPVTFSNIRCIVEQEMKQRRPQTVGRWNLIPSKNEKLLFNLQRVSSACRVLLKKNKWITGVEDVQSMILKCFLGTKTIPNSCCFKG